jgi:hypothetical protein
VKALIATAAGWIAFLGRIKLFIAVDTLVYWAASSGRLRPASDGIFDGRS